MGISKEKREQLFLLLEKQGWYWEKEMIYAPNKNFALDKEISHFGDLSNFRDRMLGRMYRVISDKPHHKDMAVQQKIVEDNTQLAKTLDSICDDGGLESFFSTISEVLESFGKKHNLSLAKYYCGTSGWGFTFRHPKGGVGKIEVVRETDRFISIYNMWWLDDYNSGARFFKDSKIPNLNIDLINLEELLEQSLILILLWDLDTWDGFNEGFKEAWSIWSKEEFEKLLNRFPIPK